MCWHNILPELIGSGTTIAAVLLAAFAGTRAYYRQKEYELVQRRYLEEGLDVLISTAESALNVYSHNWARSLEILKSFRDLEEIDPDELTRGFLDLPETRFSLTANYRVKSIVDSDIVWYTFQLVIAFCQRGTTICRDEIPASLKLKLTTDTITATREEMVNEAFEELSKLNDDSHRFHIFVGQMHRVAELFEKQRFRFSGVQNLNDDDTVKEVLDNLRKHFSDKLKEHGKSAA